MTQRSGLFLVNLVQSDFDFCFFLSSYYPLFSVRSVLAETAVGCANGGGPTMYGLKRMAAGMAVCL